MDKLISLLRFSLGISPEFEHKLTAEEWTQMFDMAHRQALVGVLFCGVRRLNGNYAPPLPLMLQWTAEAEKISGMNHAFNQKAKELTEMFADENRQSFILKGQANARLYPEPLSRQPGDIDIYVSGGRESVLKYLEDKDLIDKDGFVHYHHVHFKDDTDGIEVEVHFRPSSGVFNPFCNKRLQKFLTDRENSVTLCEYGFYIPDLPFALAMQLAHIQRHFIGVGVGLRQITDYYYLLSHSTNDDRSIISSRLNDFSLKPLAAALMWVLNHVFALDENLMLCPPNERTGRLMLEEVVRSGNFGWHSGFYNDSFVKRFIKNRIRQMKLFFAFPRDVFWERIFYITFIIKTIPMRIRHRSLSLKDVDL